MSINIQELRIENWINIEIDIIQFQLKHQILPKDLYELSLLENKDKLIRCSYIELTPKLLEKFGFKKKEEFNEYRITQGMTDFEFLPNGSVMTVILHQYDEDENIHDSIILQNDYKYLHQLQNLFFSLTGIELNDVVAYNYYKEVKYIEDFPLEFNDFLSKKGIETRYINNGIKYTIGDLPNDLFQAS